MDDLKRRIWLETKNRCTSQTEYVGNIRTNTVKYKLYLVVIQEDEKTASSTASIRDSNLLLMGLITNSPGYRDFRRNDHVSLQNYPFDSVKSVIGDGLPPVEEFLSLLENLTGDHNTGG